MCKSSDKAAVGAASFWSKKRNVALIAVFYTFLWGSAFPSIKIGYALFRMDTGHIPTQLYYADSKVKPADMVKGQAFITAAYTLGCAIGNFTGGQLLDAFNVRVLLYAGVAMAVAGTAVFFLTVDKKDASMANV